MLQITAKNHPRDFPRVFQILLTDSIEPDGHPGTPTSQLCDYFLSAMQAELGAPAPLVSGVRCDHAHEVLTRRLTDAAAGEVGVPSMCSRLWHTPRCSEWELTEEPRSEELRNEGTRLCRLRLCPPGQRFPTLGRRVSAPPRKGRSTRPR